MQIHTIRVSPLFERHYKQLPEEIKEKAKEKEKVFRDNPFDGRLKTHKLQGRKRDTWAFWVTYSYRIKFIFLSGEVVLFLDIGMHDIYR